MSDEKWQVQLGNGQIYEAGLDQIFNWIIEGRVLPNNKVKKPGTTWTEAKNVPALREACAKAQPPIQVTGPIPPPPIQPQFSQPQPFIGQQPINHPPGSQKYGCFHYGLAAIGGLILLSFFGGILRNFTEKPSPTIKKQEVKDLSAYTTVTAWLNMQKKGQSGGDLFCPSVEAKQLFAVTDYEILSGDDTDPAYYKVRVSSSTKGGIPIKKDWTIKLKKFQLKDGTMYCIEDIYE